MSTNNISSNQTEHDRQKELEQFDNTKLGVKGLVDSGIKQIPCIFHHPIETLFDPQQALLDDEHELIPVIDMSIPHNDLVELIRDASSQTGFFQVINHGVPVSLLGRLLDAIKTFHELPPLEKKAYYRRLDGGSNGGVGLYSNFDLFQSKGASWSDTLTVRSGPFVVDPNDIPDVCRDEIMEWDKEVKELAEVLMGLLSEGLGLSGDRLKGISCFERRVMIGNYYPYCPEPNKTVGISTHTDLESLTILLLDQIGGLQVKHHGGKWVNVKPADGALVVNIGDTLEMISNGVYKSGEHRVYANPLRVPRISIAVFFDPGTNSEHLYGPLPELVSSEKPALYPQFKYNDVLNSGLTTGLEGEGKYTINYFKL